MSSVCFVVFIVERDVAARRERMDVRAWWMIVGEEWEVNCLIMSSQSAS